MNKIKTIMLLCLILVSGCQSKVTDKKSAVNHDYISFTETREEKNALNMDINIYDLETGQVDRKDRIPYTTQYPLGVYDKKNKKLYYSSNVQGNDELFVKDEDTKKVKQLTHSFFAINYIFPIDDKLYIAAVKRKERAVGLFSYEDGKLHRIIKDKDLFLSQIQYNPSLHNMIFSGYSQAQLDALNERDDGDGTIPDDVYVLDVKTNKVKTLVKKVDYISAICLANDEKAYWKTKEIYAYHDNKLNKAGLNGIHISDMIYMDEQFLYYISKDRTQLCKYDLHTKKVTILYQTDIEKAAINNAVILEN